MIQIYINKNNKNGKKFTNGKNIFKIYYLPKRIHLGIYYLPSISVDFCARRQSELSLNCILTRTKLMVLNENAINRLHVESLVKIQSRNCSKGVDKELISYFWKFLKANESSEKIAY